MPESSIDINKFLELNEFSNSKFLIFGEEPSLVVKVKNHALAKEELAFTRGSKGCISIHTSSSKATNTLKFAEVWESESDFNTYFAKRVERSGEDFGRLLVGPPEQECFQTDDWGYGENWQK